MQRKGFSRKLSWVLLSGVCLAGLAAGAAWADDVESVSVTGTRIPRPELDLPNPSVSVGAVDIQNSGTINITDYLRRIPALTGSVNDYQSSGYNTPVSDDGSSLGGENLLDLRNLGYVRTLTLIDGKRSVAQATGSTAVDVNTIPITLIDRVDVVTGGSSAIYGADAVSGAVNFIMKHNLEGIHAKAQSGFTEDGGADKYILATSIGHNFDGDRGNITLTVEGSHQDRLTYTSRKFESIGGRYFFVSNPYASSPQFIPSNDVAYVTSALTGAIDSTGFANPADFTGNGQAFNPGIDVGNASAIGSSGMPYANDLAGDFSPKRDRYIGQISGHYDFSDMAKFSAEFKYAGSRSKSQSTAPYDDYAAITGENPFLPANVRDAINANGTGDPDSPNYVGLPYNVGILSEDYLPLRNAELTKSNTYRAVAGLQGDLPDVDGFGLSNFKYDLSYVYGQTDTDDENTSNRITDRFFAALDAVTDPATGNPTCRSNLDPTAAPPDLSYLGLPAFTDTPPSFPLSEYPASFTPGPNSGCVPFNPFDPAAKQQAAINFVTGTSHIRGRITQHVANGYISGDFKQFQNWGFDGPLSVVLGGEYRREASSTRPDALAASDNAWISGIGSVSGSFDVKEAFAEFSLPILKNRPWAEELTLSGAGRYSSYSTAGDNQTWEMGGVWQPFDPIKFRGTMAYAVRAPNVGELFAPVQTAFSGIADPCDHNNVNNGTQYRLANCQAIFNKLGITNYNPNTADLATGSTTLTYIGGNDQLKPESARTVTAGIVLTPLDNLVITADWYNIRITNAIQALTGQTIADECVDLSSIDNAYCAASPRQAAGAAFFPGTISEIHAQQINTASRVTSGLDVTLNYAAQTADWFGDDYGSLNFHVIGNYLDKFSFNSLLGEAPEEDSGTAGGGAFVGDTPKWQANFDATWNYQQWSFDYNLDVAAGLLRTDRQTLWDSPDYFASQFIRLPERLVQSVQGGYTFDGGIELYAGINNLFYQKPAFGSGGTPVDPTGRFYYVGVNLDTDMPDFLK